MKNIISIEDIRLRNLLLGLFFTNKPNAIEDKGVLETVYELIRDKDISESDKSIVLYLYHAIMAESEAFDETYLDIFMHSFLKRYSEAPPFVQMHYNSKLIQFELPNFGFDKRIALINKSTFEIETLKNESEGSDINWFIGTIPETIRQHESKITAFLNEPSKEPLNLAYDELTLSEKFQKKFPEDEHLANKFPLAKLAVFLSEEDSLKKEFDTNPDLLAQELAHLLRNVNAKSHENHEKLAITYSFIKNLTSRGAQFQDVMNSLKKYNERNNLYKNLHIPTDVGALRAIGKESTELLLEISDNDKIKKFIDRFLGNAKAAKSNVNVADKLLRKLSSPDMTGRFNLRDIYKILSTLISKHLDRSAGVISTLVNHKLSVKTVVNILDTASQEQPPSKGISVESSMPNAESKYTYSRNTFYGADNHLSVSQSNMDAELMIAAVCYDIDDAYSAGGYSCGS